MLAWKSVFKSALIALALSTKPMEAAPERVVSINLCTDQLLLLIGAPEQIVSLSHLARDPFTSPMSDQAKVYPSNRGQVEEIFRFQPDLVLASAYTPSSTINLLERLGLNVEIFAPESSFQDVKANMQRMGALLGQDAKAAEQLKLLDLRISRITAPSEISPPSVAAYGPNGFIPTGGLWQETLDAAGYQNAILGHKSTSGNLPLESLVMIQPDYLVIPKPYPGTSRSEEMLHHPALSQFNTLILRPASCGSPSLIETIELLQRHIR